MINELLQFNLKGSQMSISNSMVIHSIIVEIFHLKSTNLMVVLMDESVSKSEGFVVWVGTMNV